MSKLIFLKNMNKNTILGAIAIIGIIVVAGLVYANDNGNSFNLENVFGQSNDKIAQTAVDYINNNGLSSTPASLVSSSDESGLIKIKIKIGENEFDSYVTKDGKLLFPQVIELVEPDNVTQDDQNASADSGPTTAEEVQKTDNPMLDAYVVARCPYGLQMQRAMAEAVKEQPELAKYINVRYIGSVSNGTITAMHGDAEAQENLRQICIRDEQPEKYWGYVACQMQTGDTTGCQTSTGVNSANLSACISDSGRGLACAQKDFDLNTQYGVTGSPTMILDGVEISEFNFGGRSANAIKTMVCAAFNSEPGFCSTELNTAAAAVSFSTTYEGTGGSASGDTAADCAPAQ